MPMGSRPAVGSSRIKQLRISYKCSTESEPLNHALGISVYLCVFPALHADKLDDAPALIQWHRTGSYSIAPHSVAGTAILKGMMEYGGFQADNRLRFGMTGCVVGRPFKNTLPDVGRVKSSNILTIVVFPEPLGPSRAKYSPALTEKETFSTATRERYRLVTEFNSITADAHFNHGSLSPEKMTGSSFL